MDENVELTEGYYSLFLTFYKVWEDNNKVLKNEEYEIYTIDGVATGVVLEKTPSGRFLRYETLYGDAAKGLAFKTIPNVVKDKLDSLTNIE